MSKRTTNGWTTIGTTARKQINDRAVARVIVNENGQYELSVFRDGERIAITEVTDMHEADTIVGFFNID